MPWKSLVERLIIVQLSNAFYVVAFYLLHIFYSL